MKLESYGVRDREKLEEGNWYQPVKGDEEVGEPFRLDEISYEPMKIPRTDIGFLKPVARKLGFTREIPRWDLKGEDYSGGFRLYEMTSRGIRAYAREPEGCLALVPAPGRKTVEEVTDPDELLGPESLEEGIRIDRKLDPEAGEEPEEKSRRDAQPDEWEARKYINLELGPSERRMMQDAKNF
ncbi:MAG: hypothetical protein ABEK01_02410 [Candidatus Nanohaloarchaea archaeon]